ncbi:MAG: DEAD/DEAH box helicase [Bacillota bacterium]
MSRGNKYGKTWWGNAWVEALERIDYNTNRLPRGRSYANAGRVSEIKLDENGRVRAKVQGRRSKPYRVEIKLAHFTAAQKNTIKSIIARDPSLASELSLGRMPQTLLGSLENHHIYLLPESWDDISGNCSCPDWANPCKHLAAVYYIMAGEIDKEPFMLFKLRNLETGELLQAAGFISQAVNNETPLFNQRRATMLPFVPYADVKVDEKYQQTQRSQRSGDKPEFPVDLSRLAEQQDNKAIFSLLSESPLFYPEGNFKTVLLKAYKNIAGAVEKQGLLENGFSFKDTEFTLLYPPDKQPNIFSFFVSLPDIVSPDAVSRFKGEGEEKTQSLPSWNGKRIVLKRKKGKVLPAGTVLDLFLSLPLELPADQSSPWADFISAAATLAQVLARSASFVPEIRMVDTAKAKSRESFYIAYRPLYRAGKPAGKLEEAVEYLASLLPPGFIYHAKTRAVLTGTEAVLEFLNIFLTHIVHRYAGIDFPDKICAAFFRGEIYRPQRFEEQQTAKAISGWFGWLNLQPMHISPVIQISLPPSDKDKFRLKVHVENKKDPLAPPLPLAEVFSGKETLFSRPIQEVRQEVARQMTIAGEYIPVLKKLLSFKGERQAKLDSSAVAKILTEGQQVCSLLGIRVIIPKALKQMARPTVSIAAQTQEGREKKISYLNLEEMLNFSWQISLGDTTITRDEFMQLAQAAEGVVKFREHYLMLEPEAVKKILEKLNASLPRLSSAEMLRASITGEAAGIPFHPDKMLRKLIEDLGREEEAQVPVSLRADLRPYQLRGFRWLYANTLKGLGSCLADDMGLGKTVQVLALILKLKEEGRLENPALVICPTTLIGNWVKECEKFVPSLKAEVYHGSSRRLATKGTDVVITSYGVLRRDTDKFKRRKWELVIIDEAQNIKNPETDQSKAVKSLTAGSHIAMSGTPVENRLTELWSIFDFINRGYLGKQQDFIKNFAVPIEKYRDREKIRKLKAATAPFLMRRLKSDKAIIKDLPDKAVKNEYCYLSREQAALYQQVTESMMREIEQGEGIARKGLIFKLMTALKQICNHPVQYTKKGKAQRSHSGKAEKVLSLLENIITGGEKALLFTQYREMGELLVDLIKEEMHEEPLFFHGGLSRKKRDEMVENFQNNGKSSPIMIISLKAGGTGLNLTAAANVIHYDLWWNPAVENQATDRTYRIGQTQNILVHRLISLGTFEEKIDEMISAKKELADLTVATGESRLSELSNEELRALFTLEN